MPSLPAAKRRKTVPSAPNTVHQVEKLEHQITIAISNGTSLNSIADLIELAFSTPDAIASHKAIYSLYRIFVTIITTGRLSRSGKTETEESKVVRIWLAERLGDFVNSLGGLLKDDQKPLRTGAMQILMSLLRHLSTALSKAAGHPQLHTLHFRQIVNALLTAPPSPRSSSSAAYGQGPALVEPDVRDAFVDAWLSVHDDIRWFFLRDSTALLQSSAIIAKHPTIPQNLLSFLEKLTTMPTEQAELNEFWITEFAPPPPWSKKKSKKPSKGGKTSADGNDEDEDEEETPKDEVDEDWRTFFDGPAQAPEEEKFRVGRLYKLTIHHSLHSLSSHRTLFGHCWLALLPLLVGRKDEEDAKELSARALMVMHRGVMPHMLKPLQLMDWISKCVDYGESIGLLALNALYQLMSEYNLDYPDFYKRLYAFLTRDVLHLRHRARFFRLAETFLSSTHLPATLLASFVKRLSRLSLSAPPAAIIMLIPFTYNILKRHPALMVMIHNPDPVSEELDPFDPLEPSPLLTNALDSSLWELTSQTQHYLSSVSTLARIFNEAFTKQSYAMEDFLDHTYSTLFDTEAKRRIRADPALTLELPKGDVFPTQGQTEKTGLADKEEVDVAVSGDIVSELWSF